MMNKAFIPLENMPYDYRDCGWVYTYGIWTRFQNTYSMAKETNFQMP